MSEPTIVINMLDQLLPYLNKDGILEIAMRGKNSKFTQFLKIAIDSTGKNQQGVQQAANLIKNLGNVNPFEIASQAANFGMNGANLAISTKTLQMVKELEKLDVAGLVLEGVNLCATCAGFAIMYVKLDKMSSKVGQLLNTFKTAQGIQTDYEFMKVVSEHRNMLDARKRQCYYTEDEMRKLVDEEYNVLRLLIAVYLKDVANSDSLISSIFSLAEMFAVSIKYFDEIYYFNNRETITDGEVWHSSHADWIAIYDKLLESSFMDKIQDYGFLELNLNTIETDCYFKQLYLQISEAKQSIIDNQELIQTFDDKALYEAYNEYTNSKIREELEKAIKESGIQMSDEEKSEVFRRIAVA